MEKKLIGLKNKGKEISFYAKLVPWLYEGIGLMFSKKKVFPLLFSFKKPVSFTIHSYFVKNSFLAIWLDENKQILKIEKINPYRLNINCNSKFKYLIEIPFVEENLEVLEFFNNGNF